MAIRVAQSTFRHGISEEQALYVVQNCPWPAYPDDPLAEGDKVLFLWSDANGVPLEVGAIEFHSGDLLVIHAMKMRKAFHPAYERLLAWQRP